MKNYLSLLLLTIIFSCSTNKDLKKMESNSFSGKNNVLGLNTINANNNYYTKAIIDYLTVKKIIDGNSIREFGTPKDNPKINDTNKVVQVALFPELSSNTSFENSNTEDIKKKLIESGIKTCFYDLPLKLKDLKSGFQFNHYVFKSSNRAAMQAFGIVNSEIKENSLYIVTDYLQFQDINCSGLPTIRYAVGMRAEFRIIGIESESELKGVGSLAGLAAQVETNSQKVNITIKTIGLTGIDSRLSIPSNTTFDVKTYIDYEKIIDFIRNLKDNEDDTTKANKQLIVQPQIIPVMDDYRASLEYSFYPMLESIELLELKLKSIEKNKLSINKVDSIKTNINNLKLKILEDESKDLVSKYLTLKSDYVSVNNSFKINDIFSYIDRHIETKPSIEQDSINYIDKSSNDKINLIKSSKLIDVVGGRNVLIAKDWEQKGFDLILSKDFDKAIDAFKQTEIEIPMFHSSSEIINYLKTNRLKMTTDEGFINSLIYIRKNFTWRVSEEIIKKLDNRIQLKK